MNSCKSESKKRQKKRNKLEIQGCPESAGMITNCSLVANNNVIIADNYTRTSRNRMMNDFNTHFKEKVLNTTAHKEYRVKKK